MEEDKLRDVFADMVVLKNPQRAGFFKDLRLPSFMRDWIVMKFSDDDGEIDTDRVQKYIKRYVPSKEDFEYMKFQLTNGEPVTILARIRVSVDIKSGNTMFEMPDFGDMKSGAGGVIEKSVVEKWQDSLLKESENWGIIELAWKQDFSKKKATGFIQMTDYKPFCPYTVDLEGYKEGRSAFTTDEWVNVLISAADYNYRGFANGEQRLTFLQRLLPFVEKNLNIIELAPPGTGKSYLFGQISRFGWLVSGKSTRAQLIYNKTNKREGVVAYKDYVALDEIREADYMKDAEMHSSLQQIMENGSFKADDGHSVNVDAAIVFLGNITGSNMHEHASMFEELPDPFHRAPFLDRLHGFIKGWELPRMNDDMKANGWALNSEYFSSILHELRNTPSYRNIVEELLVIPTKADTRDTEAIRKVCTAFVKLLFPNAESADDISPEDFDAYCLQPAKEMRSIIREQMGLVDAREAGKVIPDISTIGLSK